MNEKFHCNFHRPAFPLWLLLPGLLTMSASALAQDPYPAELKALCSSYGRPQPVMDTPDECTTCHTLDDYTRNEKGNVWERYRPGLTAPVNPGEIPNVLATFCPAVFYNAKTDGALAPDWKPQPPSFGIDGKGYEGKLPAYWLALLANNHQTLTLSRADAVNQKLAKPNLRTAPDNCWGNSMNFGLISLAQRAKLTITVAADNSPNFMPGFALYQGWDVGTKAVRHGTIYFRDNGPGLVDSENPPADGIISTPNPLGTQGLSYLAHKLGNIPGGTAELTQTLDAGQYELFVTVGDNFNSSDGDYLVTLKTEPVEGEGTYNILIDPPPTGGTIHSEPAGIDCGSQCSGSFKTGTAVTLTAQAAAGQRFAHWTGACANFSGDECTLTDKATASAQFEILKHTVTVHRSGDGNVTSTPAGLDCGPVCAFDFIHGEALGLVATPGTDQIFQGWNGDCSGTDPVCILTVNTPIDVSAAFAPKPATPAPEPNAPPPAGPSQVDGSCGTANNVFSSTAPVSPNLCLSGVSTQPSALPDGRFTWSCLGIGANTQTARCYTLANNGKSNQTPLKLVIGKTIGNKAAVVKTQGGAGKGKIRVMKSSSGGTRCKTSITGRKIRVKFGGASGTCTLSARKLQDKAYNEVESPPLVLKVNR
ncbi:MAG: InlB B-repeat-containing protein [Methylococcus sp.]